MGKQHDFIVECSDQRTCFYYMELANTVAKNSVCEKLQVGSVLVQQINNETYTVETWNTVLDIHSDKCEKDFYVCSSCNSEHKTNELALKHISDKCGKKLTYVDDEGVQTRPMPFVKVEPHGDDTVIIHAERNAITTFAKHGYPTADATLYVSVAPCIHCANEIILAGISKVYYDKQYFTDDGIVKLLEHGIHVFKIGTEPNILLETMLGSDKSTVFFDIVW